MRGVASSLTHCGRKPFDRCRQKRRWVYVLYECIM